MNKFLFYLFIFLFSISINFSNAQNTTDEYGIQNSNSVLSGLGLAASYVNIPSQTAFNLESNGTIEMWIYPTAISGNNRCIISKGANSNLSFFFGISGTDGRLYFRIGNTDFNNTGGLAIPTNQWSHVAVTWSGMPNYTVTFYINGVQSFVPVNGTATFNINTDAVRIGGSQAFTSYTFQGSIDEVRIWSVAKTLNQIICNRFIGLGDRANSNSGNAITSSNFYDGLISSWTFNSSGTTVYDYINNYNGTYVGSAASTPTVLGVPMPYNFSVKFPGGLNDFITIPNNTNLNQTGDGTWELWFKPVSFATEQVLISKGETTNMSFILGVTPTTGKLYFGTGGNITINNSGSSLTLNQWNHIAVGWATVGSTFEVKFYKNGIQNGSTAAIPNSFPTNTDPAVIGSSLLYNTPAKGFIDEVRLWNPRLTEEQIKSNMFVSGRSITTPTGLLGVWNFDGNLTNYTSTAGLNGSFVNRVNNNCRFSGFSNDTIAGAYVSSFQSHSSVINRTGSPNPFPTSFYCRNPFKTIPDNNPSGVSDTLFISIPVGNVLSVEVFLAIEHTYVGDILVSLTAPNGTTKNLVANNAGSGKNILSFFSDNFTYLPSGTLYLPPWGFIKPIAAFGNFGGTLAEGNWVIKCVDNAGSDIGVLQGWGIKFTIATGVNQSSNKIPDKYILEQNYPNPFNPNTNIKYQLANNGFVSLIVYDALGRKVETLVNEKQSAGYYEVNWNASQHSSGVYFYKIETDAFSDVKKMIVLK